MAQSWISPRSTVPPKIATCCAHASASISLQLPPPWRPGAPAPASSCCRLRPPGGCTPPDGAVATGSSTPAPSPASPAAVVLASLFVMLLLGGSVAEAGSAAADADVPAAAALLPAASPAVADAAPLPLPASSSPAPPAASSSSPSCGSRPQSMLASASSSPVCISSRCCLARRSPRRSALQSCLSWGPPPCPPCPCPPCPRPCPLPPQPWPRLPPQPCSLLVFAIVTACGGKGDCLSLMAALRASQRRL